MSVSTLGPLHGRNPIPTETSVMENVINRIKTSNGQLSVVENRLNELLHRAFAGSPNVPPALNAAPATNGGAVGDVLGLLSDLGSQCDRIMILVERVSTLA